MKRLLRAVLSAAAWLLALGCTAWAVGALYYDFPWLPARKAAALLYLLGALSVAVFLRGSQLRLGGLFTAFAVVVTWWLTLKARNDRQWQPDVAQTAWAEIAGDQVTLHNVRNCDYRSESDYTARWESRVVQFSKLTGIDLAINYWGSPLMAHPITSFQFEDAPPLCFSIETRKETGESYSAIGGLYRQYELIYVVADERDVIRVRTNYRKGEDVFLYRLAISPEQARQRFREFLAAANQLHDRPKWYNAAATNCTTSIRTQRAAADRLHWDWRMLVNGYGDAMLFEQGALVSKGLGFAELKKQSHINAAAVAANAAPDFSARIRAGRVAFAR
jgi:hypothetical protein